MSKGPTPRHSKSPKPVTIDLDATDVTPKSEEPKAKSSATGPSVARTPDPAQPEKTEAGKTGSENTGSKSAEAAGPATSSASAKTDSPSKPASDPKTGSKPEAATQAGATTGSAKASDPKDAKTEDSKPKPAGGATASAAGAKPAAAPARSGGGLGMVVSGVLGAVIALGGAYALQAGGFLPAPGVGSSDPVAPVVSQVDALSNRLDALTQQVSESGSQGGSGTPAEVTARLDRLEAGLAEAGTSSGGESGDPAVLTALEDRLAGLEGRLAELGDGNTAGADPELAAQMNELRAAQGGLQAAIAELQSSADMLTGKITDLEQGQQELSTQLDAPSRQIDLARAIAAAGLKSAIDRGGSFMSELEAFASVAPEDPAVAELRDLAARGVPSRATLVAGFSDAASEAIAAADPGDPEAGLVDRLMSSAMSVVKVRRVGDVEGDSAEAIVARAEARLL
ncbi:MAG: hypothetical protein KI789_13865, partial [Hoeflea sp.]|nr:hypothetical protein [Hoeflea sp.]